MANEKNNLLSIIIPVYNEEETISSVLKAVRKTPIQKVEVIVVDDHSSDKTVKILRQSKLIDKLILRATNGGKGAAVRDGISAATGSIVVIQDADLEYDPQDVPQLIKPIVDGVADVVYGSRFVGGHPHRVAYFWHFVGNVMLTTFCNIVTNLNLTDMETGYKAFKRELIQSIEITENTFALEPEITIKLAALKPRFYEVGISYHGRTYEEGKKIQVKDFFIAVWAIVKHGLLRFL